MLKMKLYNGNDVFVAPSLVLAVADAGTPGRSDVIFAGYQLRVDGAPAAVAAEIETALAPVPAAPAPEETPIT